MLPIEEPLWITNVRRLVAVKPIVIIAGNVADIAYYPFDGGLKTATLRDALFDIFEPEFADGIVAAYDPVSGLMPSPKSRERRALFAEGETAPAPEAWIDGIAGVHPTQIDEAMRRIARFLSINTETSKRSLIIIENAAHLISDAARLDLAERIPLLRLVRAATDDFAQKNRLILTCTSARSLPPWLSLNNPAVATIELAPPNLRERMQFFRRDERYEELAQLTAGMSYREMNDIKAMLGSNGARNAKAVVDEYRYGRRQTDWDVPELRARLASAEETLGRSVKGQEPAIRAVANVLRRAALNLSGLQHSSRSKPRGVLFFAGPTGVGKTELAKSIARLIFNSEDALVRFDMSEYGQAHADQRLLGAPPGYVGYEEGGQLVNAMRGNPFRVLLFDEIEKAHPSVLDKFLQILEDGRITDGRGETVYFSESIIVFTSNAGMHESDGRGRSIMTIDPEKHPDYEAVKEAIESGVRNYFKERLQRPELLNRIGRNIVVFDFIRENAMKEIVRDVLRSVAEKIDAELKLHVGFGDAVTAALHAEAMKSVESGGRGVGNLVEVAVLNPLAQHLATAEGGADSFRGKTLNIAAVHHSASDDRWSLEVQPR